MKIELATLVQAFAATFSVGFGVFVWWWKGWLEENVKKPQDQINARLDKLNTKVDNVCEKVDKISKVQDMRKGVLTPIEVMVEQTYETVNHIADIQDAQFQLDGQARFECDGNGQLNKANLEFRKLFGRPIDELIGTKWMRVINSAQQSNFYKKWENLIETGIPLDEAISTQHGTLIVRAIKKPDNSNAIKIIAGVVKQVA